MWHTWAISCGVAIIIPTLLFLCQYRLLIVDVSSWAAVLMAMKQPCVGGGASISAASNQPVCDHLRCLMC
jgi:hypothetical protein